MRRERFIIAFLISVFFLASTAAKADESFSLKGGLISLKPSGKFGVNAGNLGGSRMDVDNTLGFGRDNAGTLEAAFQYGDLRLEASYLPLRFNGSKTLDSAITFNGQNFRAGHKVESYLDADILDLGLSYYFVNFDDLPARVQLGVEAEVKTIRAEVGMKDPLLGVSENDSAIIPIPTVGLRGRVALADFLGLVCRAGGLAYSGNHFIDAETQMEFSPIPGMGVYGGYRYMKLKVDHSNVFVDTSFSGPVAGLFVRF